jgi:predicted CXXCH cytochrome family protein
MGRRSYLAVALAVCVVAGIAFARSKRHALAADLAAARDLHGAGYAGSLACRRCHPDHHETWSRTFHRTMTTAATPANIRGDFSGATLRHAGVETRLDRDAGGGYRMTFATPGSPPRTVKVERAVGSRRYQQYLAREGDAFWRLPVAYNIEEKRWFPMTGAFLFSDDTAIDDPTRPVFGGGVFDRHVTRWNDNCVFCHNVAPNPGRDPSSGTFTTTVAELGIACEACHGPGAEHARVNADPSRRYALHLGGGADPTIVNPSRLSPARSADLCGRCHGQRITSDVAPFLAHGDPFVAGDDLGRYSAPLWRDTPLRGDSGAFAARFWDDGTPRLTAYEYQGLLQSACATKGGLTCTSCHGMHEGDPRGQIRAAFAGAKADKMCTGCHASLTAPDTIARHTRHDPAGEGARCVGCHMPRVVYGVLDVHRSHRIDSPGRSSGDRPDACALCHVEGVPRAGADRTAMRDLFAADPLGRAVAADALGRAPSFAPDERARRQGALLETMARDRYPAVRQLAWRSLRRLAALVPTPVAIQVGDYDPSGDASARAQAISRLRGRLAPEPVRPDDATAALADARARDRDLEIGE